MSALPRPDVIFPPLNERTTATLTCRVQYETGEVDASGSPILGTVPGSAITAKAWTLRTEPGSAGTPAIINSRAGATDGLTIDEDGHLALTLTEADTVILDRANSQEWRRLLIALTFDSGHRRKTLDVRLVIDRTEVDA